MTTLKKLELTRPEKAVMVSAMCFFETGGNPTINNIDQFFIGDAKKILEYPGIKELLFSCCKRNIVIGLMRKIYNYNDL